MYELTGGDKLALDNLKLAAELIKEVGAEEAWRYVEYTVTMQLTQECRNRNSFHPMDYATYTRKKPTHTVNGIECPAPETGVLEPGDLYFMPSVHSKSLYVCKSWLGDEKDISRLKAECIFLSPKAAAANTLAIWPKLKSEE